MSDFELFSKASKLCLTNAKQYVKDAKILYSTKSYGHALALTIFSDIELGKAVIYHLCSKDLISKDVLPDDFHLNFEEGNYDKFVSETWWVGLVLASNVDALVPSLFNLSNLSGKIHLKGNKRELSQNTKNQMFKLINEMHPENEKIKDLLSFACEGFFVKFAHKTITSPNNINKSLVKERIKEVNERIVFGEPFLLLSFSEVQKRIAEGLLKAAFESIIPMKSKIEQLNMPLETC